MYFACIPRCGLYNNASAGCLILGVHLVEPILALTYNNKVTFRELIPSVQKLYENLIDTEPRELFDLSKPAFDFVTESQFATRLWPKRLLDEISSAANANEAELVKIFRIMLPKLVNGWFWQRGDVFRFGNFDQGNPKLLVNLDPIRLENASINNMAAERQVGRINYEIKIQDSKGFECTSSSNVKAQSAAW